MNVMKAAALLFLLLGAGMGSVMGQNSPDEETVPKDPQAKAVLDKLTENSKTYKTIKAEFEYRLENKDQGLDEKTTGALAVKGEKYRINVSGQLIINNTETVWTYLREVDEVTINCPPEDDEDNLFNPSNLLTMYENGFKYKYDHEGKLGDETVHFIKLFPMDPKEKPFHTVKLAVNKESTQVKQIMVFAKDGNVYTYTLTTFNANTSIPDSEFEFDDSEVDEVVDLREDC